MTAFQFRLALCAGLAAATLFVSLPASATDMDTCYDTNGQTAIDACTRLIKSGKYKKLDLAKIYNRRGVANKIDEKYDLALADYNSAISIEPTAERYSNRANTKRLLKDIDGALADMKRALDMEPGRAVVFANRGLIWHYEKQDYDRAISDYDQAIRLDRNHTAAYTYRAQSYEEKGDLQRAREDYRQAASMPEGKYTDGKWGKDYARDRLKELDAKK